ncbi:MAG: hypothetical protein JWO44_2681 [Bacteroidetes bacterium]|nr:hypothetical protein [Bacteroidota bacterium]
MKHPSSLFLLFFCLTITGSPLRAQNRLHAIPAQTPDLSKLTGETAKPLKQQIHDFEISDLVTFREYKEYLSAIKDSSMELYQKSLPDTGIAPKDVYLNYISNSEYDDFPVLGISWDNAMKFCKWKTQKENHGDSLSFIYRLPALSEWLSAYAYYEEKKTNGDFNKNYSDWLLNSKDESFYDFADSLQGYDWFYFHASDAAQVMKRKLVIGNSYVYQQEKLMNYSFSYYATEGYRQIAFRYVKEYVTQPQDKMHYKSTSAYAIIKYWGLNIK